ncbi:hypothetical protein Dda_9064 [Drechslerella dactyloides]|uniref:Uncharacterized protein n=1 Tax=Drechslerella dactyloides TaxID=74499 RepID=A0AAD6IPX6_DREDA|nr:hypothetical protein Dda_9064 [Drechslerella dactyloides]
MRQWIVSESRRRQDVTIILPPDIDATTPHTAWISTDAITTTDLWTSKPWFGTKDDNGSEYADIDDRHSDVDIHLDAMIYAAAKEEMSTPHYMSLYALAVFLRWQQHTRYHHHEYDSSIQELINDLNRQTMRHAVLKRASTVVAQKHAL